MRAAILGWGRFGAALGGLLDDHGVPYRALDVTAAVPEERRARSPEELLDGATHVVLAVPVPAIRAAAEALAPLLVDGQLVLDVGSVKVEPVAALAAALGSRRPWVGTHPLFGPTSLSRAERPLRVVVCPNASFPEAAGAARAFYERLSCEVREATPEAHDRAMARTHVLSFFVAKGLLAIGAGDEPFAPPSFQAMARTLESVRGDAGHLFAAIQRGNPFAAAARRELVDALTAIDAEVVGGSDADEATLSIPALAPAPPELSEARGQIDAVDRELLALLTRRTELARRAGRAKAELGLPVRDPEREAALLADREAWGVALGLDGDAVRALFEHVVAASRRAQHRDRG